MGYIIELLYKGRPKLASEDLKHSTHIGKLFSQSNIDKDVLRKKIKEVLKDKSQTTLSYVIENSGGIAKELPELFGYISIKYVCVAKK